MKNILSLLFAFGLFSVTSSTQAVQLTQTNTGAFTALQTFVFSFSASPQSTGSGIFTLTAQGDLICCTGGTTGISSSDEIISWNIDGLASGVAFDTNSGASLSIVGGDFNNRLGNQSFTIDAATMANITADGWIVMTLKLGSGIDIFHSSDFVTGSLSYDATSIPEPTSLALLGLGLGGLLFSKRKKR